MRPLTKLAAFALALAATFGAGAALGAAVGPVEVGDDAPGEPVDSSVPTPSHEGH
jgi:hypothetical protein